MCANVTVREHVSVCIAAVECCVPRKHPWLPRIPLDLAQAKELRLYFGFLHVAEKYAIILCPSRSAFPSAGQAIVCTEF